MCPTLYAENDGINSTFSIIKLLFSGAREEGKFKKKVRVAPVQQKLNIKEPLSRISHIEMPALAYIKKEREVYIMDKIKVTVITVI